MSKETTMDFSKALREAQAKLDRQKAAVVATEQLIALIQGHQHRAADEHIAMQELDAARHSSVRPNAQKPTEQTPKRT